MGKILSNAPELPGRWLVKGLHESVHICTACQFCRAQLCIDSLEQARVAVGKSRVDLNCFLQEAKCMPTHAAGGGKVFDAPLTFSYRLRFAKVT